MRRALVIFGDRQGLARVPCNLQGRAGFEADGQLRVGARAGEVVGHADTDFELIPGGDGGGRIRRENEVAAYQGAVFRDSDGVIGYGDPP